MGDSQPGLVLKTRVERGLPWDCERYAIVADAERLIWSGRLASSDGSEPNRAAVED